MIIRNGFVSNSSSTITIVSILPMTKEIFIHKVKGWLNEDLKGAGENYMKSEKIDINYLLKCAEGIYKNIMIDGVLMEPGEFDVDKLDDYLSESDMEGEIGLVKKILRPRKIREIEISATNNDGLINIKAKKFKGI